MITPEEEAELSKRKKDFSIVISSRSKCANLFMGPARFANHDCDANARLMTTGQAGIEIIATKNIEVGDEITVTYGENYFGEDNCECLCKTCENNFAHGWAAADGSGPLKRSIEVDVIGAAQGYSLRRRRRDGSISRALSETPSVTPDIRPRVRKGRTRNPTPSGRALLGYSGSTRVRPARTFCCRSGSELWGAWPLHQVRRRRSRRRLAMAWSQFRSRSLPARGGAPWTG